MEWVPFGSVDSTTLRWLRVGETPLAFHLLAGDQPLGALQWNEPGGTRATATTNAAAWTLKRVGFLNPRVTVRVEGADANAAQLTVHLNYHRVDLADGGSYRFHRAGVLLPAWKVYRESGEEILHVEPVREGRKLAGGAVIAPAAATRLPEFALLVVLSWYFIALAWFEDEAIASLEAPDSAPAGAGAGPRAAR